MAGAKDFWVPTELALEILGFNKNILEKRISADYIKKEVRGGIELLEISGEIERFGLSEDVAREKLDKYINAHADEMVEKRKSEIEKFKPKPVVPEVVPQNIAFSSASSVTQNIIPVPTPTPAAMKMVDYTPQLNKISQVLDDIRKLTVALPDSVNVKQPKDTGISAGQMLELKTEFSKINSANEQNQALQKEIASLQTQLKAANQEVTKLNTQANAVMDELERVNQKHNREIENLKTTIKTEIASVNTLLTLKAKSQKGFGLVFVFLILAIGALGFLIYELIHPTYSVLVQPNEKINPITKKDVTDSVKSEVATLEANMKNLINSSVSTTKEEKQKILSEINALISTSLESQKEQLKKTIESLIPAQKETKPALDENVQKVLKSLEAQLNDIEKQIKKLGETTVAIKPGTKFMPDNNE